MIATRLHPLAHETAVDMCAYGKQRPDNNNHIKKPTKLIGTKAICEVVTKRCDKDHYDGVIQGSMNVEDKSVKVSVWAGG